MNWICCSVTGMGKGQHRMPSKDELVQRYNRMNTIPQVLLVGTALVRQNPSPGISSGYRDGWGSRWWGRWVVYRSFKESDTF